MNLENSEIVSSPRELDIVMHLDRLSKIFENVDIVHIKYDSICNLNYAIMDMICFIDSFTDSYADENKFIFGNRELTALGQLKRALHKVRRIYYYNGKKDHNWIHCDGACEDCDCSESVLCIDCEVRIELQHCLDLIDDTCTLLKEVVKKYKKMMSDSFVA